MHQSFEAIYVMLRSRLEEQIGEGSSTKDRVEPPNPSLNLIIDKVCVAQRSVRGFAK